MILEEDCLLLVAGKTIAAMVMVVVAVGFTLLGGFYVSVWRLQVQRGAARCYY